jgi:hypothetical protein
MATQHLLAVIGQDLLTLSFQGFGNILHCTFLISVQALLLRVWKSSCTPHQSMSKDLSLTSSQNKICFRYFLDRKK